jgi:hypothetical protein
MKASASRATDPKETTIRETPDGNAGDLRFPV